MPEPTSLADAFATPWIETLPDGTELKFIPFDLDDYTEILAGLNAQREKVEQEKVDANSSLTPYERAKLMIEVRKDKLPITYAMWYRRLEPAGIKVGLRKAIVAGFPPPANPAEKKKLEEQADALVRRIKPTTKMGIADYLVDPYPMAPADKTVDPKKEPVSTNVISSETDGSSKDASPESVPEA